jgi:hypothetical protein
MSNKDRTRYRENRPKHKARFQALFLHQLGTFTQYFALLFFEGKNLFL